MYFFLDEDHPIRKKVLAGLAIPLALLSIIGVLFTALSYFKDTNITVEVIGDEQYVHPDTPNYYEVAINHLENGNYTESLQYLELSLDEQITLTGPTNIDVVKILNSIGMVNWRLTRYSDAIDAFIRAITTIDSLNVEKSDYQNIYLNLADVYVRINDFNNAEKYIELVRNFYTADEQSYLETCMYFLFLEYALNQGEDLDDGTRRVLEFDTPDEINPKKFDVNQLAEYLDIVEVEAAIALRKEEYESALIRYDEILAFWDYLMVRGIECSAKLGVLHDAIGICSIYLGKVEKGTREHTQAVEIFDDLYGTQNVDTGISMINMGSAYLANNDIENAYNYSYKGLAIIEKIFGESHDITATAYNNIAFCLDQMGEHDKAEIYYSKSIEVYEQLGIETLNTLKTYISYSHTLLQEGKLEEAKKWNDKAYYLAQFLVSEDSSIYLRCLEIKELIGRIEHNMILGTYE